MGSELVRTGQATETAYKTDPMKTEHSFRFIRGIAVPESRARQTILSRFRSSTRWNTLALALALTGITNLSRGDITIDALDNGMTTTISFSGSINTMGIGKGGGASITGKAESDMGTRILYFAPNARTAADYTGNVIGMGSFVVPDGYFLRNINSPATNHMGDIFRIEAANLYYPVGYVSGSNISGSIVINDTGFIDSTMVRQTTLSAGAGTITFNPVTMPKLPPKVMMPPPPTPDMNAIN